MACTIEDITDKFDTADVDKALGELLVSHDGDVNGLLVYFFDFLKRKTNFFKDPEAKRRVMDAYKQVAGDADGLRGGFFRSSKTVAAKPAVPAAGQSVQKAGADTSNTPTAHPEVTTAPVSTTSAPAAVEEAGTSAAAAAATTSVEAADQQPSGLQDAAHAEAEKSDQGKTLKPNAGRGADLGKYSWTQSLSEVTVAVPVGRGVKAKQLDVVMKKQHLIVGIKGQEPVIDGILSEAIKPDDSMWNLADGVVELTLTKAEGMHWWKAVLAEDPEIDVQAVEPESSKLTDLDPETRQTVEKMMFDQRQKALGLPTSEEMQKQDMLKRFMAAHPEMDFSNAKIM